MCVVYCAGLLCVYVYNAHTHTSLLHGLWHAAGSERETRTCTGANRGAGIAIIHTFFLVLSWVGKEVVEHRPGTMANSLSL
jgi:hypothetical protein